MGGAGKNVWPALNGVFEGFHRSPRGSCHSASVAVGEAQSNQSQPKSNRSELADAQNPGHCNVAASDWGKNPPKTASKGSEKESQTRQAQPNIPGKTRLCAAAAKCLNSRECVPDDAVRGEPVCFPFSLLSGKRTGILDFLAPDPRLRVENISEKQ